ncbi:MAG: TetR/AcrR family transcriptional regulator [Bacteroidota bacterium]|jgi:AcrR family transcriptional regulator
MGISERKERDKQKMRELILDAAMRLFLDEGYHNVSIRRIADRIEYSPATIYLYFKDKDDILYALHNAGFEKLLKLQRKVVTIKNPAERLRKQGELYIKFALENPEYYNLMFITRGPARKLVKDDASGSSRRSYDFLRNDVQAAINAGIFTKTDAEVATFALWSLAHGIVSLILRDRCPMMDKKALPAIAREAFEFLAGNIGIAQ